MNLQKLLKEAQKMQKDHKVKKDLLEKTDFDFENQGISLTISGGFELKKLKISPFLVDKDDIETLEDLISITLNQALLKIREENEKIAPTQSH
ncbi:YbaB/EbfC family nucleoid-associated protein [Mesomycoplasma ovipneumoniae]|uniref:YbaB/EbfC family nucleoid-associated protein n=1 Tax=Mesomycoplasma ovipneumoniae TaxID=29562 RepID=UPI002162CF64|nr:YbaB/EbfC family nucleoid-associated protein [Mesomycoplasma ovipneumoniae]MDW2931180.1 YbaB/EbfC family nucleoid-associated protein [Mesomycoplasma ovipneumoniae]UVO15396.1 YbaB/EbfC family nucleoid-associated protein [Mesomycoplasma ovipneumoniae]